MLEAAHMEVSECALLYMVNESRDNETENSLASLVHTAPVFEVVFLLKDRFLFLNHVCFQNFDLFYWPVFPVCLDQAKLLY